MAKTASGKGKKKSNSGVIEIDLNKVEVREAYDGDDPRPGFYTFELVGVRPHTSQAGNEGIAWLFSLVDNPLYEGWTRITHTNMDKDSTLWKTQEVMLALAGGNAVKGTKKAQVRLDINDEDSVARYIKAAKKVRGRVQRRRDSEDDDPQFELGKIIALDEAKLAARAAAEGALADDDEDEDEDGFEDADEFDDADEDEDDDSDEEDDEDSDDDEDDDEEEDDEDEDLDDEDDEEEEDEPEPPKKTAKKAASKPAAKATSKKATGKVTNIADAKSKKAKSKK